jgi:hypothetical protein
MLEISAKNSRLIEAIGPEMAQAKQIHQSMQLF